MQTLLPCCCESCLFLWFWCLDPAFSFSPYCAMWSQHGFHHLDGAVPFGVVMLLFLFSLLFLSQPLSLSPPPYLSVSA